MTNQPGSRLRKLLALTALSTGLALAQSGTVTVTSAGTYQPIVAPGSVAVAFGTGFASGFIGATTTLNGSAYVLPTTVGGTAVSVTDNSKTAANAAIYMVSPDQINFVVPPNAALGAGTVSVQTAAGTIQGPILISNVSPAIMTANGTLNGAAAADVMIVGANGQSTTTALEATLAGAPGTPISLTQPNSSVYLIFYGTGIRNHSLNPVIAQINGVLVPVTYAGPQNQFPGLDMVTVGPVPASLAGSGTVNVAITVDGVPANVVQVAFK